MAGRTNTEKIQILIEAYNATGEGMDDVRDEAIKLNKELDKQNRERTKNDEEQSSKRILNARKEAKERVAAAEDAANKINRIEDKSVSSRVSAAGRRLREAERIDKEEQALQTASALRRERLNKKLTQSERAAIQELSKLQTQATNAMERDFNKRGQAYVRISKQQEVYTKSIRKMSDVQNEARKAERQAIREMELLGREYLRVHRRGEGYNKSIGGQVSALARLKHGMRDVMQQGGVLSRRLGRLGLALRGLIIVGAISFTRALIASMDALAGSATALAGSLIYAAGALGGTFVSAASQAIPVIGLLIASFQRLAVIQNAVQQAELAKKQAFGDSQKTDTQAADNTNQIADANNSLKEAQQGVTEARKEARKELDNLIYKEREAELALRGSILSQVDSQRALREAVRTGDVEGIAQAQLDVDQSAFDVGESRRDLRNVRRENRTKRRQGVNKNPQVVDAIKAVADAQRNLADAHTQAAAAADDQSAAESALGYYLSQLSPAERRLFNAFMDFKKRFIKVTRPITDIIINAFTDGLGQVQKLLFNPQILSGFTTLARGLSDSIGQVIKVFSGREFTGFFVDTLNESAKNLPIITKLFIIIARILKNIAEASAPVLTEFLKFFVQQFKDLETITGRNSLTKFFQTGFEHFKAWWGLLREVLGLIGEIMGASSDSAVGIIRDLTDTIREAKEALAADDSGARKFFEDSAKSLSYIGEVLVAIGDAFLELSGSQHVKALADIIIKVLIPGLKLGIKFVGGFAIILDHLLDIPLVDTFLQWAVAFAVVASAAASIAAIFKPLWSFFKLIKDVTSYLFKLGSKRGGAGATKFIRGDFESLFTVLDKLNKFPRLTRILSFLPELSKAFGIVGLVIAGLIGTIEALRDNFLGVRDILVDNFKDVADEFTKMGDDITETLNNIVQAFSGSETSFKDFGEVVGKALGTLFKILDFLGKVVGSAIVMQFVQMFVVPLKGLLRIIRNVLDYIKNLSGAFSDLVQGNISFGEFLKQVSKATLQFMLNTLKNAGSILFDFIKNTGKFMWKALSAGLEHAFSRAGETVVNAFIDAIGWIIDVVNKAIEAYNKLPIGDIDTINKPAHADFTPGKEPKTPDGESAARRRGGFTYGKAKKEDEEVTKSHKKRNKETKKAADLEINWYKSLSKSGGASRRQVRLNNMLADSLGASARSHKRATQLQSALSDTMERSARKQRAYAESVKDTVRAERRLSDIVDSNKKVRNDSNQVDKRSVKVKGDLSDASKDVMKTQSRLNKVINNGTKTQADYNQSVVRGTNFQDKYKVSMDGATKQSKLEAAAIRGLTRKLGILNGVLKTTGENSVAMATVFRDVTNKLLTEFGANPIKVKLPTVEGMFKAAGGGAGADNFAQGGYFGRKGQRKPDDRMVKVAGGEAFLTGAQQAWADKAFAVSKAVGAVPYGSLDSLFAGEKRAHAGTGHSPYNAGKDHFNQGGRNGRRGNVGGQSIVLPKSVPDADGALPGLDLMAWLANKYFGLSVTAGKNSHSTMTTSGNVSDHSWGGAVDLSNGSSPTPQMDAAWHWFAKVLGGYSGSEFIGDFSGGAIKQMLYRISGSYGNHYNHVHLALLEQYANNVESLTKILTGKAVPIATGGGSMLAAAPQLKVPKIKGKSAPANMLRGQAKRLTKGANKLLSNRLATVVASGSGLTQIRNIKSFEDINHVFAEHNSAEGDWGGPQLPFNIVAALAESAGLPGITFAQIAQGESNLRPGATGVDPGGTKGFGLWMITNGYNDELIARLGGEREMLNPVTNARAAKSIFDSAGYGAWYGTQFVTAYDKHYEGKFNFAHARGGKVPQFHDGVYDIGPEYENDEFTKRLFDLKNDEVIAKLNYGESVIPRSARGKAKDIVPDSSKPASARGRTTRGATENIRRKISRLLQKIKVTEDRNIVEALKDKIEAYKDDMLLIKEREKFNDEIRDKNKEIRDKEKELEEAKKKEKKKKIRKELADLRKELTEIKIEKRSTRVFEGAVYNIDDVNDYILLISDRINSFMADIDETVSRYALATARWTYQIRKVGGKNLVSRVHTATAEAVRALSDLIAEYKEISQAIAETRRDTRRTTKRLNRERRSADKDINENRRKINSLRRKINNSDDGGKNSEWRDQIKTYQKEIDKLREEKTDNLQKLRTSLKNTSDKRKELLQRQAENVAARYEAQNAIFEEVMNKFDAGLTRIDTAVQIATLKNSDEDGELTEDGKKKVKGLYLKRREVLQNQGNRIQERLRKARRLGDKELVNEMKQALLDNKLALLENTQNIKDLKDKVEENTETFDFKSTNWEIFRRAVLNGNGDIVPALASTIPSVQYSSVVPSTSTSYGSNSSNYSSNAGPLVDTINFTQPMEVADPIAISNQIGFKLSTMQSNK